MSLLKGVAIIHWSMTMILTAIAMVDAVYSGYVK